MCEALLLGQTVLTTQAAGSTSSRNNPWGIERPLWQIKIPLADSSPSSGFRPLYPRPRSPSSTLRSSFDHFPNAPVRQANVTRDGRQLHLPLSICTVNTSKPGLESVNAGRCAQIANPKFGSIRRFTRPCEFVRLVRHWSPIDVTVNDPANGEIAGLDEIRDLNTVGVRKSIDTPRALQSDFPS